MTVVSVTEDFDSGQLEKDKDGKVSGTRSFRVVTSNATDGAVTVLSSPLLPKIGSAWVQGTDTLASAVVTKRKSTRSKYDLKEHLVEITYEGAPKQGEDPGGGGGGGGSDDGYLPDIAFSVERNQVPVQNETDGTPITNSSKERPENPVMGDEYILVLDITRRETSFDPATALYYLGAINGDKIFDKIEPKKAKLTDYSGKLIVVDNAVKWLVHYQIKFRQAGWITSLLDEGLYHTRYAYRLPDGTISSAPGANGGTVITDRARILDAAGLVVAKPVLLNGSGQPLEEGRPAVYLPKKICRELAFSALDLPPLSIALEIPQGDEGDF